MQAHEFQRECCKTAKQPILNAACKEDPAKLGENFNAVNLDLLDFDPHTNTELKRIRNFVQGDVSKLTEIFTPGHFPTIVLGEFLEHCSITYAHDVIEEVWEVLPVGGSLIVTFPRDDRPAESQHGKQNLKILVGDRDNPMFTTWHRTVWNEEELAELFHESRWKILKQQELNYGFTKHGGLGMVLEKLV